MMKSLKSTLFLFFISSMLVIVSAQDDPILIFQGKVSDMSGKKIEGVNIVVKKDGSVFKTVTTTSTGRYSEIECVFGHMYELNFSKSGFVSKRLVLDTKKGYYPEDIEKRSYIESSLTLFQEKPDVDYSIITDKPVGKARINPSTGKLDWDYTYSGQRKKEIDNYIKQVVDNARQQESLYKRFVNQGDVAFSKKDFNVAIINYKEALRVKDDEAVKKKIINAENSIALFEEEKQKKIEFDNLIQKGDNLLVSNKFDEAIVVYDKAKEVLPGDQLPYIKIKEANQKKDDLANAEINAQFKIKINEANRAFDQKDWINAKKLYNEAIVIKPNERGPKDRIIQIDGIIAKFKSDEEKYTKFISEGDQELINKEFDKAISKFQSALKIKPTENHPKEQITKAELLKKEAEQQAKLENQYQEIIKKADVQLKRSELKDARESYKDALTIKPNETYPKDKISEIDAKIKEIEEKRVKDEELKRQYNALIVTADGLFYSKQWEEAKKTYLEAKNLKPDEDYPQQRIDEIVAIMQKLESDKLAEKQRYDNFIKNADVSFNNERWEEAKINYNNALSVLSNEAYPKEQLVKISEKIAEEISKKAEEDSQKQKFNKFISDGDNHFSLHEYQDAKDKYLLAKDIFPDNSTVIQKILKVDAKLKELKSSEELKASYNNLITKADASRDAKKWEESKDIYLSAINIMPNEIYPHKQIELINDKIKQQRDQDLHDEYLKLIKLADEQFANNNYSDALDGYIKAKELKPEETYPNEQIREIRRLESQLKDKERRYNSLIAQADIEYESERWEKALITYGKAVEIKEQEYPKNRIIEINKKLEQLKTSFKAEGNKRKQYNDLISKADREFDQEEFTISKSSYEAALVLFENEYYPKKRISEIELKLKELESINKKKSKYNELIVKADATRDAKRWLEAKKLYRDANIVDDVPTYPQEQINWINNQMKKETENEFKQQYEKLIAAADEQLDTKNYIKSKELYLRAKNMNPEDTYPVNQIDEVERRLKGIKNNKIEEDKLKEVQNKYKSLISQADASRDAQKWNRAKNFYNQAHNVFPDEAYPEEQIDWINTKMQEIEDQEAKKLYSKILEVADKMYVEKNYTKALELYRRAKGINPADPYPPEQIRKVEEDRISFLNNEKEESNYNSIIKSGNTYYELKKYRLALKRFQSALKIKPEATYPANKITEINSILDKIAAAKINSSNVHSDNMQDNYRVLYGEEVTGKYNESQIDKIFIDGRINVDDERHRLIDQRKDDVIDEIANVQEYQIDQSGERNVEIDKLNSERSKEQLYKDNYRLKVIPQIDHYKDMESFTEDLRSDHGKQVTNENRDRAEDLVTGILSNYAEKDIPRQEVVPDIEYYKDGISNDEDVRMEREMEHTFDNDLANERMQTARNLSESDKDIPRQNLIPMVDTYKDDKSFMEESEADYYKTVTYSNYDNKENLDTRISNFNADADNSRQENVPVIDSYKDEISDIDADRQDYGQDITYTNYDEKEALDNRISKFSSDADIPRQELSIELDHYQDKESYIEALRNETGADKIYNVYSETEMLDNVRYSDQLDKDITREMNAIEVESFLDKQFNKKSEINASDIYNDHIVERELDEIKATKPTDRVDSYKQQLAVEYPEGITEKMFERKNGRGDVLEVTILRIVIRGNKGDQYRRVTSKWGVCYFKNGVVISEYLWDLETN